ncbi:MAG: hypothetical protein ACREH3_17045, partial [Geminicoccales bacterium]
MGSLANRLAAFAAKRRGEAMQGPGARAAPSQSLSLAFERICKELGRPFSAAEIEASAPPTDDGMTLPCLLLAAERLGFRARE